MATRTKTKASSSRTGRSGGGSSRRSAAGTTRRSTGAVSTARKAVGAVKGAAKRQAKGQTKRQARRRFPVLRWLSVLSLLGLGGGSGALYYAEKYADQIPHYQRLRAQGYTWRDRVLRVEDPTITIRCEADALASPYDNLVLGVPGLGVGGTIDGAGCEVDCVLDRRGYALGYSNARKQPLWVAYTVTADEVRNKVTGRSDDFRVDPYVPTGSARNEDYSRSGYDRGHLAPAADMAWSKKAMSESFYFSNMSPQRPEFNRGIWMRLEEKVRDWAVEYGKVHVVTGPVFHGGACLTVGLNCVAVPDGYYKVIYAPDVRPPAMIGFILPNAAADRRLYDYAVTVAEVEQATGLQFFTKVDPPLRDYLSCRVEPDAWRWLPNR